MKGIKILQKKKKTKRENMAVNAIKISLKMKNKSWLSIEKDVKCEKINERSLNKVSVSTYKSINGVFLEWSRLQFLTIRVVEIGAILGQCEAFETKYIEFLY